MTLLRLIADDAPAAELAEAADRVAAKDPAARDLALRIRSGTDASKRREAELSALVESPGNLYDAARGDTFIRATDGSVSTAFQQLRLSTGARQGERSGRGVRV